MLGARRYHIRSPSTVSFLTPDVMHLIDLSARAVLAQTPAPALTTTTTATVNRDGHRYTPASPTPDLEGDGDDDGRRQYSGTTADA